MSGPLRVGDAERERAAAELAEHFALGRIDGDEHAERLDAAWSARSQADLDVLFADLPPLHPPGRVQPDRLGRSGREGRAAYAVERRRGWRGGPLVPILVVLGVLTVLTHIPFVLIALAIGAFMWSRANRRRRRAEAGPPQGQLYGWR